MNHNIITVPGSAAIGWLSEGWRLFKMSWLTWILGVVVLFVTMLILNFIPVIGQLVALLLQFALPVVIMIAFAQLDRSGAINWTTVFEQTKNKVVPILVLAAINFGLFMLFAVVVGGIVFGGAITSGAVANSDPGALAMVAGSGGVLAVLLVVVFSVVLSFLNYFAAPLIAFSNISAIDAIKHSIKGCLLNIASLLVFWLIAIALGFVATIPLGLGLLILGPVLCGGWYTSAKQIFPDVATPTA